MKEPVFVERTEGPTPAGGTYAIAYYLDDHWHPVDKGEATTVTIHEYDENDNMIFSTVGKLRH